ncbi:MAG: cysteine--tRNA ligase [Gammaproteobacteria bacterium]|nr:cysteine--tRNA ligase [Gammaproteobacteria bacterium]MDH3447361.1 cysteine--tRNA ligase [Gammaproteobacteria bacterium]
MLSIYNSLTNQKEEFVPIVPGQVRMYVCGMTVYDYCHIGHARVLVVFDVVYRFLKYLGYDVTYVRNITDIDDKIINRAVENNEAFDQLTMRFIEAMHEDADALGVQRPDIEPRATDTIDEMLAMIEKLQLQGYAYQAANGDVYFSVSKFADYGKLSGKRPEELRAGERVEIDTGKQDPLDFVLWKSAKVGEPSWPSRYGDGRPGWHIECSAMSNSLLGNHFDIHGGGQDLQFPHHENEIAQSEACNGEKFVNYWMHNGFVRVNEEKMSKSLGNFFILRDVLKNYRAEEIRYFIVSSHYRSQLNYAEEQLDNARAALQRLYAALQGTDEVDIPEGSEYQQRFEQALCDDFNTASAIAVLFDLVREINRCKREHSDERHPLGSLLRHLGGVIGLLQAEPDEYLKSRVGQGEAGLDNDEVEDLVQQRLGARAAKDWAAADRIRDQLSAAGIVIEDGPNGTRWRRA